VTEGRIESRRAYSGRILSLDVDRVRFPDGSEGELEMVRHPGASAIVPFLSDPAGQDPEILLIRQYRYAAGGYLYEAPAGCLEPGEAPVDCARRELREETGCEAEHFSLLTSVFTTPGFTDEVIHLFMATGITRGASHREADEFLEVETMSLARALMMIQGGEIRDAKTIVAVLFAAGFRAGH
jgi:ADP-ribose pyrophosphatase